MTVAQKELASAIMPAAIKLSASNPIGNLTSESASAFNGSPNNSSTTGEYMSAMQSMGNAMSPSINRQCFILAMPTKQSDDNSISYSCEQQKILLDASPMTILFCEPKRKHSDRELLAFLNCDSRKATSSCHSKYDYESDEDWDEEDDEDFDEAEDDEDFDEAEDDEDFDEAEDDEDFDEAEDDEDFDEAEDDEDFDEAEDDEDFDEAEDDEDFDEAEDDFEDYENGERHTLTTYE